MAADTTSSTPFQTALELIDGAHSLDPRKVDHEGDEVAYELVYSRKMTHFLSQLRPSLDDVPETLRLAIRAQHFRRWEVPRSSYPMTRVGYHSWRTFLKKRQAELVSRLCVEAGYGEADAERVAALIRKEDLKSDADTQLLEDVACLVFLEDKFEEFKNGYDKEGGDDKVVDILRKTWAKMSVEGRTVAQELATGMPYEHFNRI
ncbi:hypothetical protein P152DRAFT_463582 [Eremomyces bilateralis CBS 781.70]|uniref:Glutamyl-tRNA synthetase n=1 Tax=Eremomyces bilateralis CBS 781.70 TaxID=1392243 RepID=A0A6G1GH76_9PEZI|nr:uncharacterized protein P152DRAFT_463582 [Eremomyces bilateralis CBS 781.70]KAF1817428.1 hypothetical protein P152DRAFT_463582 [Eremomyces bilateralis CBS 781.70]